MQLDFSSEKKLPSLRNSIFLNSIATGLLSVTLVLVVLSGLIFWQLRKTQIDEYNKIAFSVASIISEEMHNIADTAAHLDGFKNMPGFKLACVYDKNGILLTSANLTDINCPALITKVDSEAALWNIKISEKITYRQKEYVGILYVELEMILLKILARDLAVNSAALYIFICLLNLIFARNFSKRMMQSIEAISKKLNVLQKGGIVKDLMVTKETESAWKAISDYTKFIASSMISNEDHNAQKRKHIEILSSLLETLRTRLPADSPLLPLLSDYSLLMLIEDKFPLSSEIFEIKTVTEAAFSAAKNIHPYAKTLYASISLDIGLPKFWSGQKEVFEAIIRHLMLISLQRTKVGMARIRIATTVDNKVHYQFYFSCRKIPVRKPLEIIWSAG